jgi:hypothetical protein
MKMGSKLMMLVMAGLIALPAGIFAHGAEAEAVEGTAVSLYVFAGTAILLALLLVLFLVTNSKVKRLGNVKKQEDREKRQQLSKTANVLKWSSVLLLIGVIISGTMAFSGGQGQSSVEIAPIDHMHGMGYSSDGKRIFFAVHDGLRVYSEGHWSMGQGERHDYMGYSAVDDGFYSSGHPARGSGMKNPFGLLKSTDEGKSLETLSHYGQVDFHGMTAGYQSHIIYVLNPMNMSGTKTDFDGGGLFYTKDEGKTWVKSAVTGLGGETTTLAAHRTEEAVVAIGTQTGLYLSRDHGNTFEQILSDRGVTALHFNSEGKLIVGGYNKGGSLQLIDIDTKKTEQFQIPILAQDAVMNVAENPVDTQELVLATFSKDIFLSDDRGKTWTKIADQGQMISH